MKNMKNKKEKDIKKLGVPNVCFSIISNNDNREEEYSMQRINRGFDDSETWSLRSTFLNFIIPRLERYNEITKDKIQEDKRIEKDKKLFLKAAKLLTRDNGACIFTETEEKIVKKGMKKFHKIIYSLWW